MLRQVPLRVVIAGGGTGGHLYPGIAVAQELRRREPDAHIVFAGTARGIESRVVPREGFVLEVIRSAGLKRQALLARVRGLMLLPLSAVDAWRVIWRYSPHLVIGVGGYSSGPLVLIAALRRIPTLVLEQNAVPGATNRILSHVVEAAAVTYDTALPYFKGKGFVSGNPVRPQFFAVPSPGETDRARARAGRPHLLVLGGSQGAHAINAAMADAAADLAAAPQPLSVTHQAGEQDLDMVRDAYRRAGLQARVEAFLDAVYQEMGEADLVVCRAGATTLAELAASGRPAILVPLPSAADGHQWKNAEVLTKAGAADRLDQASLSGQELARRVIALVSDEPRRTRMASSVRRLAQPDAARVIVDRALKLVRQPS